MTDQPPVVVEVEVDRLSDRKQSKNLEKLIEIARMLQEPCHLDTLQSFYELELHLASLAQPSGEIFVVLVSQPASASEVHVRKHRRH